MALSPGRRLAHFEVLSPLGAGGMGEVYRARDLKLGRDVALKVLAGVLADSLERRARFEREARLLATLNHSGIAAIHGLEDDAGTPVLVMELVEGETLDKRLDRGPLPVRQALEVGRLIAEGLEAAHEKGIIHRDLKPSNVKLTPEGKVKLLDFGLAKALEVEGASSSVATLTTPSDDPTRAGVVLGTAPYMSPEQARGEELDRRTDIWSFGCVLYETLTAKRAFGGRTRAEAVAAVLEREPEWQALPAETPVKVHDLLRRCLQKDRAERLHDIGDARIELKEAQSEATSGPTPVAHSTVLGRRRALLLAGGLAAAALLGSLLTWTWLRPALSTSKAPARLTLPLPPGVSLPGVTTPSPLALSPSGRLLVFVGVSTKGAQLYLRELDALEAKPIPQTEGAMGPLFSPDGRWLAFWQDGKLRKVPVEGGPPIPICDAVDLRGASWGPDDTIVFTPRPWSGLWCVSVSGGAPRQLTAPDETKDAGHRWAQILPGGRAAVFTVYPASMRLDEGRLGVVSLETGQWRVVLEGGSHPRYVSSGHLLYGRDGVLLAAPFDAKRLEVKGPAVPVLDDVRMDPLGMAVAHFEVSPAGSLAYVPGYPRPVDRSLLWVDRHGRRQPVTETRRSYLETALSPDGRRLAVRREEAGATNLWVLDLARETWTRLTSGKDDRSPVWSPDGTRLAFSSNREGMFNLYWIPADGSGAPERLTTSPLGVSLPSGWSPDGRLLAFTQGSPGKGWDVWILPLDGERQPRPLLATSWQGIRTVFSPDGRWLAYDSDESGRNEVYVRAFPVPGPRWQVSKDGGQEPRWARNGREIFYRSGGKSPKLMSVTVEAGTTFRAGTPKPLFDDSFGSWSPPSMSMSYDVSPDGQRFLMIEQPEEIQAPNRIVVIPDFASELKAKLRAAQR